MPTLSGQFAPLVTPLLRKVFVDTGKERPTEYDKFMNVRDMKWVTETERQVAGLGSMPVKTEGDTFTMDDPILGGAKVYTAVAYGLGVEITREMYLDDLYGYIRGIGKELQKASRNRIEVDAHAPLNNANSATGINVGFTAGERLYADGTAAQGHLGLDGNLRRNRPTVDVAFGVAGIQDGLEQLEGATNERNRTMMLKTKMVLVSQQNRWAAREVLGSTGRPYTGNNEINALVQDDLTWMIDHYLTDLDSWHALAAKEEHDLNFLMRDEPVINTFDYPLSGNVIVTIWQRHVAGWGSWRGVFGVPT